MEAKRKMNYKNIIAFVELFANEDIEHKTPLVSYFLTKTGTLYEEKNGELVYRKDHSVISKLGVTGRELLDCYSGVVCCPVDYDCPMGTVVIDDNVVSEMLVRFGLF